MVINSVYTKHTKGVNFLLLMKKAFSSKSPRQPGHRQSPSRDQEHDGLCEQDYRESFKSDDTIAF